MIKTIAVALAALLMSGTAFAQSQSPKIYAPNGQYLGNLNYKSVRPQQRLKSIWAVRKSVFAKTA